MALCPDLDNTESLRTKINQKACVLFGAQPGKPQLQVNRLIKKANSEGKESIRFEKNQDVIDRSEIEGLWHVRGPHIPFPSRFPGSTCQTPIALYCQESNDLSQIFIIRQNRSWTTLNISRELFGDFLSAYGVFSRYWRFVFTFGIKWEENEFEFPGFASRHISPSGSGLDEAYGAESAYILRRAELNNRKLTEGQSPWSIRQTAVYHKFSLNSAPSKPSVYHTSPLQTPRSTFLLITPSQIAENQLHESFEPSVLDGGTISLWNIHRLLIADSLSGWMDYMAWMEVQLREQSSCVALTNAGAEKDLSALAEFGVDFKNRQTLKLLEDSIIDLQIILSTKLSTITGIRDLCNKCCEKHHSAEEEVCECDQVIEDFNGYVKEVETHIERAKALRERASGSELTAVPDYKKHKANGWKNFFSTQFVHTGEGGNMRVSTNAWLLAAIAVPLTVLTIVMWWIWVRYVNVSLPSASLPPNLPVIPRKASLRALFLPSKKQPPTDIESGIASPQGTVYKPESSPRPLGDSGIGTWSSTATTVKSG
ncbi:hypothetical protein GP486_004941 [Trichoglossum hirsutum]|uniref:CorA-like transporter domain-containing protein n=1 Tax=Trichoglossum hirsutum TaxID=265104 RepID=A0A9P8LA00_9PEZI|nr:hypothetical protein GP486_004941 [Trichoglossum hirsutum]